MISLSWSSARLSIGWIGRLPFKPDMSGRANHLEYHRVGMTYRSDINILNRPIGDRFVNTIYRDCHRSLDRPIDIVVSIPISTRPTSRLDDSEYYRFGLLSYTKLISIDYVAMLIDRIDSGS
jgi:hypothetical protein